MTLKFMIARKIINNLTVGLLDSILIYYEDYRQVFFTATGRDICDVVADFNGIGMDDANHVHDEVLVKLRCKFCQFYRSDRVVDTVHYFNNYSVRDIYRNYICV